MDIEVQIDVSIVEVKMVLGIGDGVLIEFCWEIDQVLIMYAWK